MTRYEAITKMNKVELATFLCDLWLLTSEPDSATGCDLCPMESRCWTGNCGWRYFLDEEFDDRYTTGASNEYFK